MSMSAGQRLRIGERSAAAQWGRDAAMKGENRVAPTWAIGSVVLVQAFNEGYDEAIRQATAAVCAIAFWNTWSEARRQEVATDGAAR